MDRQVITSPNVTWMRSGVSHAVKAGGMVYVTGATPFWGDRQIAKGDFAPGFFIEHFLKDLGIALAEAESMGIDLPGASLARKLYNDMADKGHGRLGTQALFQLYMAGV